MAPSWVLLDRTVSFVDGGADTSEDADVLAGGASEAAAAIGESSWDPSPREAMAAMIPNPVVVEPPKVTFLDMLRQTPREQLGLGVCDGEISSTDKNLVVLYSGFYRPGNGGFSGDGCYLVYDASSNSLSAAPPLPETPSMKGLGRSAAIVRHSAAAGDYSYSLVELVTTRDPGLPEATLWVWSIEGADGRWIQMPVLLDLPGDLCGPTRFFEIDMVFSFAGRIFWVDLLTGVLVCDLATVGPKLSFIPCPSGYSLDIPYNRRLRLNPEEFRSMGCVCGAIKFLALVGYTSACSSSQVVLKTWTLSSDFKEWKDDRDLPIGDLWASQSFKEMNLPQIVPMCPVLSMNEDGVVYVILNDIEKVEDVDEFGEVAGVDLVLKANYRLGIDTVENKVMFCVESSPDDLESLTPTLLASEFSAYLQDPTKR